jgi:hypothetical protein
MDIMPDCDFIPFQCPRKKASKRLVYPNTLSHTSSQNLHHTYLHRKNAIPSIVYVPCICIQNHTYFIVQFEAHGKVAVYGGVHLCKLYVCHLLVGVKLNHAVMEQDFQCSLSCFHTPWVMHIFPV